MIKGTEFVGYKAFDANRSKRSFTNYHLVHNESKGRMYLCGCSPTIKLHRIGGGVYYIHPSCLKGNKSYKLYRSKYNIKI